MCRIPRSRESRGSPQIVRQIASWAKSSADAQALDRSASRPVTRQSSLNGLASNVYRPETNDSRRPIDLTDQTRPLALRNQGELEPPSPCPCWSQRMTDQALS